MQTDFSKPSIPISKMGKMDDVYAFFSSSMLASEVSSEKENLIHMIIPMEIFFYCGMLTSDLWDILFNERVVETTPECFLKTKSPITIPENKEQPPPDDRADQDINIFESPIAKWHTRIGKNTRNSKPAEKRGTQFSIFGFRSGRKSGKKIFRTRV